MTRSFTAVALAIITMMIVMFGSNADAAGTGPKFVAGHILVQSKPGLDHGKFLSILTERGGSKDRTIPGINVHVVKVPVGTEQAVVTALSRNPNIQFAEVDTLASSDFLPNDPNFAQQWYPAMINAPQAWDVTKGTGVTIAILDTGVNDTHEDLAANMVPGWNVVINNTDTRDLWGHGTAVAGTAAATGNNALGIAGIAYNANIMPLQITSTSSAWAYSSDVAEATVWATDHGAKVINCSFGYNGGGGFLGSMTVVSSAQYAHKNGALFFNSAGNSGTLEAYENNPYVISVGATNSSDTLAGFSTYGNYIDVTAPGENIMTTMGINASGYGSWSGTSFSSPAAAGVAALIWATKPTLSNADVETILKTTVVDRGTVGWDMYYGYGRVDTGAAVMMAQTYVRQPDTAAPVASIDSPIAGATVSGIIPVSATASDNVGVSKVDLYINGAFYASDTLSPYSFSLDTKSLAGTDATLVVKATDAAGNIGTSSGVTVRVATPETIAPIVTISSPANGAKVSGKVVINASATDNIGVSTMTLHINDKQVASATGASLSYTWNAGAKSVKVGIHSITVKATDAAANTGTHTIQVTK